MAEPDDGDRRYDEIKNGDRPPPPQLRSRFRFREYPAIDADTIDAFEQWFPKIEHRRTY